MTPNLSNLKVLVVDDSPHMRVLIRNILKGLGIYTILEAANGQDALEVVKCNHIDVAIADLNMEPVNGMEFLASVRRSKDSPNPFLPVILATGDSRIPTIKAARDAGVNAFLTKPVSVKTLAERLFFVLQDRRKFIRAKTFFGPDRRFRVDDGGGAHPRRRSSDGANSKATKEKVKA